MRKKPHAQHPAAGAPPVPAEGEAVGARDEGVLPVEATAAAADVPQWWPPPTGARGGRVRAVQTAGERPRTPPAQTRR